MLEKRALGKTGERLSIIGMGGIVVKDTSPEEAKSLVAEAVERGVNYFDVAPTYGNAEERLGPALEPYRNNVFLACKTTKRRREDARIELERSLQRLKTDHVDLYQLHGMATEEDYEGAIGPGGALETFVKAKEEGLTRFLGFSAHSAEIALRLMDVYPFDTLLFPVNWTNYFNADFGPQVVERATEKGMGCLAIKGMARQRYAASAPRKYAKCWYEPIGEKEEAVLALRFTLSQQVTAAVPPGEAKFFRWALDAGEQFTPVSGEEVAKLQKAAEGLRPLFTLAQ